MRLCSSSSSGMLNSRLDDLLDMSTGVTYNMKEKRRRRSEKGDAMEMGRENKRGRRRRCWLAPPLGLNQPSLSGQRRVSHVFVVQTLTLMSYLIYLLILVNFLIFIFIVVLSSLSLSLFAFEPWTETQLSSTKHIDHRRRREKNVSTRVSMRRYAYSDRFVTS